MANKTYQARVQSKIDTSENWAKATNFVPLKGEICIYSDLHRMKVGDGTSKIGELDFEKSTWITSFTADTFPADGESSQPVFTNTFDEILAAYNNGFEVKAVYLVNDSVKLVFNTIMIVNNAIAFGLIMPPVNYSDKKILDYLLVQLDSSGNAYFACLSIPKTDTTKLLPEVSTADNNKVLKVEDGAWQIAKNTNCFFPVQFTVDETAGTATADKTVAEIQQAFTEGLLPVGIANIRNTPFILSFAMNSTVADYPLIAFAVTSSNSDGVHSTFYLGSYGQGSDTTLYHIDTIKNEIGNGKITLNIGNKSQAFSVNQSANSTFNILQPAGGYIDTQTVFDWDGNISGKTAVTDGHSLGYNYYLMSNRTNYDFTQENIMYDYKTPSEIRPKQIYEDNSGEAQGGSSGTVIRITRNLNNPTIDTFPVIIIVPNDGCKTKLGSYNNQSNYVTFPKAGTYVYKKSNTQYINKLIASIKVNLASDFLYLDTELSSTSENPVQNKIINSALNEKADKNHTHNYAGSSSTGGAANSANKLNTDAGSATHPVYFKDGVPVETTYTLGKSVPSDAKFTDTVTEVDATLTDNGTNPVQGKVIKSYVDDKLSGLTGAMHFIGKATVDITDGSTTDPVISGYDFANKKAKGDVILGKDDNKEFVWDGTKWELLGDEGSYALKTELNTKISKSGDTMSGDLGLNGHDIRGVGNLLIGNSGSSIYISPDTVNKQLLFLRAIDSNNSNDVIMRGIATPVQNTDAVNKKYVDDTVSKKISKSGDTFSGTLTYNGGTTGSNPKNIAINVGQGNLYNIDKIEGVDTIQLGSEYNSSNDSLDKYALLRMRTNSEGVPYLLAQSVTNGNYQDDISLRGIGLPTEHNDAANKYYVDNKVAGLTAADVGAATASDITNEIGKLDVTEIGGTGKYIQSIQQTDGKISATPADMPTALKNPNALTFTGAVTGTYDGSAEKTVNIPIVDSALNATSTNAVQNKAAKDAIDKKISKSGDTFSGTLRYAGDTADSNPKNYAIVLNSGSLANIDKIDGINEIKFGKDDSSDDCIACLTTRIINGESFLDVQKVTNGQIEDVLFRGIASPIADNDAANKAYVNAKVPDVTTSDNNKFLRVVNGTPSWVALTNVAEEGA